VNSGFNGQIHGIKIDSLLQMVQIEGTTCTLRVQTTDEAGLLYVLNGELIDAETGELKGLDAAKKIISWPESTIEVENTCERTENVINQPLMNILAETVQFKDERKAKPSPPKPKPRKVPPKRIGKKGKRPAAGPPKAPAADMQPAKDPLESIKKIAEGGVSPQIEGRVEPVAPTPSADKPRKKRLLVISAIALGAALVLMAGIFFGLPMIQAKRAEKEFINVMLRTERQPKLEEKVNILTRYINSSPNDTYISSARIKIKEIQILIEKRDFMTVSGRVDTFMKEKKYEDALAIYRQHLNTYPRSIFKAEINQKIADLSRLADDTDYEKCMNVAKKNNPERIELYLQYLKKHPEGKHRGAVETLITNMRKEYYYFVKREIGKCTAKEDWEQCVQLCDKYVAVFPDGKRSGALKDLRESFNNKFQEQIIFEKLVHNATVQGDDYNKAKKIYTSYLRAYPESPLKSKIEKEIVKLDEQIKQIRVQKASKEIEAQLQNTEKRFVVNGNGTVTDTETDLMWCMLDSLSELGQCVDYMTGIRYVKDLRTGGYQDWRLPTAEELQDIYKRKPFYPTRAETWYWTSKSYSRFSDGWSKVVDIVTSKQETVLEKKQLDSRNCGAVHAVRP
jgi:tetratricopeptide (TPR) repeat protein